MTDSPGAASQPVVRVLPLLGLAHLDREFDYLVTEADSRAAQPGSDSSARILPLGVP